MKPDYRRMDRKARDILLKIVDGGSLSPEDYIVIDQLRAIPKPGGGKPERRSPGSGKKKTVAKNWI